MNEIKIPDTVLFQEVGEEAVLLSLEKGHYFGLDQIGTRVWSLIKAQKNAEEIVASITAEYDVDANEFRKDLEKFLAELTQAGLLTA